MLRVLYQDNHLLVVEKPAGVLSQSDQPDATDDLLNQAKAYVKKEYNKPGDVWLGLVHRLDRDVGGVMIFARTSKAAGRLSEEIREGRTRKMYRALIERLPRANPADTAKDSDGWIQLEDYIVKDINNRKARAADPRDLQNSGKRALLMYRTVGRPPKLGPILIEIKLETGRFHQIRFQLASRGAPILGDRKYGSRQSQPGVKLALHCVEMGVSHPVRGEFLSFACTVPGTWPRSSV